MSRTIPDALDYPFTGEPPEPKFAEAQQWWVFDGQWGVMNHLGTMPGDLSLWHNVFTIACPDESIVAAKLVGRGAPGTFGGHTAHTVTIEPYKKWRVSFDGAMRRYGKDELWTKPAADGAHVSTKVDLEFEAAHPVWEPGQRKTDEQDGLFQTTYRMHHEQALRATGTIRIGGETIDISGIGHRDHSQGPRERKAQRGFWVNATFDSGWAFCAMAGYLDPGGLFERTAIFDNTGIVDANLEKWSELAYSAPLPREFEMVIVDAAGRRRVINVSCKGGANYTGVGDTEWCLGTDLSDPKRYIYTQYFAEFECEGEKGLGFVDRGAKAALLQYPPSR